MDTDPASLASDRNLLGLLATAHENAGASVQQLPLWLTLLEALNKYFAECREVGTILAGKTIAFTLIQQAYSYWMAGVELVLSGLLTPAYAEMRALLESSLYAFYCRSDVHRQTTWMERDRSEDDRNKAKREFRDTRKMMEELCDSHILPTTYADLRSLYEDLVDMGAHPNVVGALQNMATDGKELFTRLFNCGGFEMRAALKRQAEVGYLGAVISRSLLELPPLPTDFPRWIQSLAQLPLSNEDTAEALKNSHHG
jgi:hypothetical protein